MVFPPPEVLNFQKGELIESDRSVNDDGEADDHAIAQLELVRFGQTVEQRHVPFDQIVGLLNHRQFTWHILKGDSFKGFKTYQHRRHLHRKNVQTLCCIVFICS